MFVFLRKTYSGFLRTKLNGSYQGCRAKGTRNFASSTEPLLGKQTSSDVVDRGAWSNMTRALQMVKMVHSFSSLFYYDFNSAFYGVLCVYQQDSKEGISKHWLLKQNLTWRTACLGLSALCVLWQILFCQETFWHPESMQRHLGISNVDCNGEQGTEQKHPRDSENILLSLWAREPRMWD